MSLSPDTHDPRRANLTALRWDSAWIDPALRRMAETAAQRAGIPVEAWMERAIRKACGMPEAVRPAPRPVAPPAPVRMATESQQTERQRAEPQFRAMARAAMTTQQARPSRDDGVEPLALTQLVDPPAARPAPTPRLMPPPQQPRAARRSSGLSVILAGSIAAVLAILAVMVVRDPTLVTDRLAALTGEFDQPAATVARVTPPQKRANSVASNEAAPLRVVPRKHDERAVAMMNLPPPSVETGVTLPPATNLDVAAAPPPAATTALMPSSSAPIAAAPIAEPRETTPAPKPVKPLPVATATRAEPIRPVQMAALPSPNALPAAQAAEPQSQRADMDEPAAPAAAPIQSAPPTPVATVSPAPAPLPPAPAPMSATPPAPATPKAVQAVAPPAPAPAPTQQVAMSAGVAAPAAAPAPIPPVDAGTGAQNAADVRVATDLQAKVKAGDHIAEYRLGILYALGKGVARDYDYAAKLLHRSAESGLPEAQYDYGVLCDKGLGVPRDSAEAARWYGKAAQQGHPPAALNLGYAYAEGLGVVRNLPEAARWFRRAAEAGLVNAQFNLAYMYEQGAGIAKSPADAYAWYSVAAEKGDQGAQQAVERIASRMTPRDLQAAKARIKAVKRSIRIQN